MDLDARGQADSLAKLEEQTKANVLDAYPTSNISQPTHEPTIEEQLAESPNAINIGRSAVDLTHPRGIDKIDKSMAGMGHIEGQPELCNYLLDAAIGTPDTAGPAGTKMYDIIARLECDWGPCRLCQHRMNHVYRYCMSRGKDDPGLRGLCEHSDPETEKLRRRQMVFPEDDEGMMCRTWKDQMINERCNDGQAAFCQGAHTVGDACSALANNPEKFLQRGIDKGIDDWSGAHCYYSTKACKHGAWKLLGNEGIYMPKEAYALVGQDKADNIDSMTDTSILTK